MFEEGDLRNTVSLKMLQFHSNLFPISITQANLGKWDQRGLDPGRCQLSL